MQLADYDYDLPESAIAIHPPATRGDTRLLRLNRETGAVEDGYYKDLADYLNPGDLLVINNTKVLPARLRAKTEDGADRELLLLEKHGQGDDHHSSLAMYRRKLHPGQTLQVGEIPITIEEIYDNGTAKITSTQDLWKLAEKTGSVPLPPYMHRDEEPGDRERYQTEFAKETGSVAAPTASLNMTSELLELIKAKGVEVVELTLHVGLGTFMPIRVDDVTKHKMHQEYFEIPSSTAMTIRTAKQDGRRVIAVGTTVTRTLEFAANEILQGSSLQDIGRATAIYPEKGRTLNRGDSVQKIYGEADIFIYPGYRFKIVDGLLTNFHAPHSTVLMMAAAFAGWDNLKASYEHALAHGYQFLSYGDSMLIT